MKKIDYQTAFEKSCDYFDGDELAANVFLTKYAFFELIISLKTFKSEAIIILPTAR